MPTKDIRVHLSQNQMGSFYIGLLNLHWARKCLSDTKVENDNLKESQFTMKTAVLQYTQVVNCSLHLEWQVF